MSRFISQFFSGNVVEGGLGLFFFSKQKGSYGDINEKCAPGLPTKFAMPSVRQIHQSTTILIPAYGSILASSLCFRFQIRVVVRSANRLEPSDTTKHHLCCLLLFVVGCCLLLLVIRVVVRSANRQEPSDTTKHNLCCLLLSVVCCCSSSAW